ncbi:MAG: tetratricopeptide repeat protein, partial [Odoribacteraceae bacterium]|nr:tetratricopeptide repeat protein [Odoribacteraceae bacterium]
MKKRIVIWIVTLAACSPLMAQQERRFIRGGNDLFHTQKFEEAEVQYRKALEKEDKSYEAAFNLADALYKQKKYDEAFQQFSSLAKDQVDKEYLGELYHNIGNTLLAQNKLDECIEFYKQSLRNRPNSQETKYNLEFARKMKQE